MSNHTFVISVGIVIYGIAMVYDIALLLKWLLHVNENVLCLNSGIPFL